MQRHLDYCTAPLLSEPWILDMDSTVKPIYGHQDGAVQGYNPKKPGRPSHVYHTYMLAGLRLILDVEVAAGNQHTSNHAAPGLWAYLDRIGRDCWPAILRGDSGFATEGIMREAEQRTLPYLFKLRQTANVKRLIKRAFSRTDWRDAGQGWEGRSDSIQLEGWSRGRRVVIGPAAEAYEYAVLVTSLDQANVYRERQALTQEPLTLAQLYRDRADSENPFDELKNEINPRSI